MTVGATTYLIDGDALVAVNRETGASRWRSVGLSLTTYRAGFVVNATTLIVRDDRSELHALDPATGVDRWRTPPGPDYDSPVLGDGLVYTESGGDLHALAADSGATRWTSTGATSPLLADDTIYAAARSAVRALDPATGTTRWELPVGARVTGPLVLAGDLLLVSTVIGLLAIGIGGN